MLNVECFQFFICRLPAMRATPAPRARLTDKKYTPANGHVADVALRRKSASPPNRRVRRHVRAPSPAYVLQSWNALGNIPWTDASGAAAAESRRTSR